MSRYTTKTMQITINDEVNLVGGHLYDNSRYISAGSNTYVLSAVHMPMLTTTYPTPFKYVVNTIPSRSCLEYTLHGYIYIGSFYENTDVIVYSHGLPFRRVAGVYLSELTNCVALNFVDTTAITDNIIKSSCMFNNRTSIIIDNMPATKGHEFIYWSGCIMQQYVNIKHTNIIHPLACTYLRALHDYVERFGVNSVQFKIPKNINYLSDISSIELHQLKMLFSADETTWYTYDVDTSAFVVASPAGSYFTFSELNSIGVSYSEYIDIPISTFTTTFGEDNIEKIHVLSNGWLLPRYIKHSKYSDIMDVNQFLWMQLSDTCMVPYKGDI